MPAAELNVSSRDYLWVVAWKMFLAHPFVGNGPFTYVTQFVQTYSVPPNMMLPHAHNLYFNVLGEMGLLGFAAMCFMAGALVWLVYRLWRSSPDPRRMILIGAIASLAGLAVHNLFDIPTYMPAVALVAISIAAFLVSEYQRTLPISPLSQRPLGVLAKNRTPAADARTSGAPEAAKAQVARVRTWQVVWVRASSLSFFLAWLAVTLVLAWQAWALQPYYAGISAANQGSWRAAASDLEFAASRDPWLALNWFQAGFSHSMLALDRDSSVTEPAQLDLALRDYHNGLSIEPAYATNWANLGLLEWAAGDAQDAIQSMQKAASLAFSQPAFALTAGRMLESTGDDKAALAVYRQVLQQSPGWAGMLFFQGSPLRKQAAGEVSTSSPTMSSSSVPGLDQLVCQAKLDWFEPASGTQLASDLFALGDAEFTSKLYSDAVQSYQQGLTLLNVANSYGIGRGGVSQYTVVAYNRLGIETDLLPGIDYPVYNARVIQAMLNLASAYTDTNDISSAIQVYNEIISIDPLNQSANEFVRKYEH